MRLALIVVASAVVVSSANAQTEPSFADGLRAATKKARDFEAQKAELEARRADREKNATVHPRAENTASLNLETIKYVIGKLAAKGENTYVLTNHVTNPCQTKQEDAEGADKKCYQDWKHKGDVSDFAYAKKSWSYEQKLEYYKTIGKVIHDKLGVIVDVEVADGEERDEYQFAYNPTYTITLSW